MRRTSSLNGDLGFPGFMRGITTLRMIVFTHRSVDVALGSPTAAPAPTPEASLSLPATAAAAVCAATSAVGAETDDPAEAELQRITNNNNAKRIEWAMGTGGIEKKERCMYYWRGGKAKLHVSWPGNQGRRGRTEKGTEQARTCVGSDGRIKIPP